MSNDVDESERTIQRYIRLTQLDPTIQKMVDDKKIGLTPAVELSYLKPEEQKLLLETMESEQATPSLSQAQRLKKMSQENSLNEDNMLSLMMAPKKPETTSFTIPAEKIKQYFPKNYTLDQIQSVIFKLLERWQRQRNHDQIR